MENLTAKMGAASISSESAQPKHSNLYVSGLGPSLLSEQALMELFSPYGKVDTCRLVRNSRDTKSFAFVKFDTIPESLDAIAALNKKTVGGGVLEVKTADAGAPGWTVQVALCQLQPKGCGAWLSRVFLTCSCGLLMLSCRCWRQEPRAAGPTQ